MSTATRRALLVFLLLLIPLLFAPLRTDSRQNAPGVSLPQTFTLDVTEGRYTLKAHDALLTDILRGIEARAGLRIDVDPALQTRVTAEFQHVALEELLSSLAQSHAFVYEKKNGQTELVSAALTSEEQPVIPAPPTAAPTAGRRDAREQARLDARGILCNSDRPAAELRRRGAHALILENALIDTDKALREKTPVSVPEELAASPDSRLRIVQFDGAVSARERMLLETAGIEISHYVPNSAFAVRVDPGQLKHLRELPGVRIVEPYHPYYKLSSDLLAYRRDTADERARRRVEQGEFNIMVSGGGAADALKKLGAEVVREQSAGERRVYTVQCSPDVVMKLVRDDSVVWAEPHRAAKTLNDMAGRREGASSLKLHHPSLTGEGVTIAVTDTGADYKHRGFAIDPASDTSTSLNTRIAYYAARAGPSSDGVPGDADGHGSHVAGSILGNGAYSETVVKAPGSGTPPYAAGQFAGAAPKASLVMIEDFNSFSDEEQAQTAYRQGARISNNSWGNEDFQYGTMCATWDALVRDADSDAPDDQPLITFFAAGNSGYGNADGYGGIPGTVGQPGNAKNVISVGAVEQARFASNYPAWGSVYWNDADWQVAHFSSRGPTFEGRVKPDIVAPGTYVLSIQSRDTMPDALTNAALPFWDYRFGNVDSGTNYAFEAGTSMASPLSAGAAALVYQYYTNLYNHGPSPALMKAILVNGARMVNPILYRYPPYGYTPDTVDQGWGSLDVSRAVDGPGLFATEDISWSDQDETTPLATGQSYTRQYVVAVAEGGLKVTLAWTDAAGTPGAGKALVNDLDLVVIAPDGSGYVGNWFDYDGVYSYKINGFTESAFTNTYVNGFNALDNVEQVLIPNAGAGTYTIKVIGAEVPEGPQDFALAVTKGVNYLPEHSQGDHPALVLDTNDAPVVAYSGYDAGWHKQIFVKRWVGPAGGPDEIGLWKRLDERWFDLANSGRDAGISQTVQDSVDPSIALRGNQVWVAWEETGADTSTPRRIYLKHFNGANWVELANSARDNGVSGASDYSATDPVVKVGSDGMPVVSWLRGVLSGTFPNYTFTYRVFVARWTGSAWTGYGTSMSDGVPGSTYAARPDLTLDSTGNPVVAWEEPTAAQILVYRWTGSAWSQIGTLGGQPSANFPRLAAVQTGGGTVPGPDVNLALASRGSTITGNNGANWSRLIDGVTNGYTPSSGFGYTYWQNAANAPGQMTLDLKSACTINSMRLLLWDVDTNMYYRYRIEASANGSTWSTVVDRTAGDYRSWQTLPMSPALSARYLRLTGTHATLNDFFSVVEWQVYGPTSTVVSAIGPVFITYVQQPNVSQGQLSPQVYVQVYSNSAWSGVSGSATYPGISGATNASETPYQSAIALTAAGRPMVAWQAGSTSAPPNSILVKTHNGAAWQGSAGSDVFPGVSRSGGSASQPAVVADRQGLPVVAFQTLVSAQYETMVYRMVFDESPPGFDGLRTATGGTNHDVRLEWLPASDASTTIYYRVYRSTGSAACGTTQNCTVADVFGNLIATRTNVTTYTVTNLVNDQVYCFGVRAVDTNGLEDGNTVIRTAGPVSSAGDSDGDCINNPVESAIGTEPCIRDTDGDGMWDGWEYLYSTNNGYAPTNAMDPLDNGRDRVNTLAANDGDARQLPDEDLDGDGISNLEEFEWWSVFTTNNCAMSGPNPTMKDTDGDGIPDGWEVINGLNPTDNTDAAGDADSDGLTNLQEYQLGTDPQNPDSDSDGIPDGTEFANGTDPSRADSDRDGLDDGVDPNATNAQSLTTGLADGDVVELGYPGAVANVFSNLLRETFETSSITNWTHQAMAGFDLWHVSTADPVPPASTLQFLHQRSPATAYRFANDPTRTNPAATYQMGSSILRAWLQSPRVDASGVPNLFVGWNEFVSTEAARDLTIVHGRGGSDTNWYVVSNPASGVGSNWVWRTADLSRFAGLNNVQVRFLFSADNRGNGLNGWYVDDVWLFSGTTITGWVRNANGGPIVGARVLALGRGGLTNAVEGHRYVNPGTIFGEATTRGDGTYRIVGLPQGRYYVKATDPNHTDEFYDGPLYSNYYGFGRGWYPGVADRDQVSARGWVNLTGPGAQTNCDFELESGAGRAYLGTAHINPGSLRYSVYLNGGSAGLALQVWNGSTSAPAFVGYQTTTTLSMVNNHPDWITNPVPPALMGNAGPGTHLVFIDTNLTLYPAPQVTLREGEITLVDVFTNQGEGRIYAKVYDGAAHPVWINGRPTTNQTPAVFSVKAGRHQVMILPLSGSAKIAPKYATVPLGGRAVIEFSSNDLYGIEGCLTVRAADINGNAITGAVVYLNGREAATNDVLATSSVTTPMTLNQLKPGQHLVTVRKEGYQAPEFRLIDINSSVTNTTTFILHQADRDYDRVGDWTEIDGYTNLFLYDRDDDPDGDGLNNLFEFDQFRLYNVFMDTFNADSDGDGMTDGAELGYDGRTNVLALSTLASNTFISAPVVYGQFVGQFLAGVNNFGNGNVYAAIECDRFEAGAVAVTNSPMPSSNAAMNVFSGVPAAVTERAVTFTHNRGAELIADTMPNRQDTDGDGMWDGFEAAFMNVTNKLDPIECGHGTDDPDGDGLDNYHEFLGPDGLANTNDWTNPTSGDTDGDGMPDGWEVTYGLDPYDPSDADDDPDGDGLINLDEYHFGTNPWLADTDADGLDDGTEVGVYGTDPTLRDTDNDFLTDGQEVWDRDGDGVFDGGFFPFWFGLDSDGDGFTDGPTDWDTDGDGMPDGYEVLDAFGNVRAADATLDPTDPNDGDGDADGDGLSNLQEWLVRDAQFGNAPGSFSAAYDYVIWDYPSDPFRADSDGDGMPDGWEAMHGLHPMDPIPCGPNCTFTRYPDLAEDGDADHDGLWNLREFNVRFTANPNASSNTILGASSSPWNADSDGDGLGDGEEDRSFRSNPVQEDTDGDRLKDGTGTNWWGEVDSNPLLTNHFDRALNDLWRLTWPATSGLPVWEKVVTDTTNVPPPRWGAASTYIPIFEAIVPCCTYDQVMLDDRQFVLFGGRNGVNRYTDIWEYVIASNTWSRSFANLSDADALSDGLSELSAVTLFGYCNNGCEVEGDYSCLSLAAGVLVERPNGDNGYRNSSFDWTYILGGWGDAHEYRFGEPMVSYYYKAQDHSGSQPEVYTTDVAVIEFATPTTSGVDFAGYDTYLGVEPLGAGFTAIVTNLGSVTTNIYTGLNGVYFSAPAAWALASLVNCATGLEARMVFRLSAPASNGVTFDVFTEFTPAGYSWPIYYQSNSVSYRFAPPAGGWFFNSSVISTSFPPDPVQMTYTVDVTRTVYELVNNPAWYQIDVAFVLDARASTSTVFLANNAIELQMSSRRRYLTDAYWRAGTTPQPVGDMPSRRKSMGMVYDYRHDRVVAFGGLDGKQVFAETYEGTPNWYGVAERGCRTEIGVCEPCLIYWEQKTNTVSTPPARWGHSMVYDPEVDRVVLFGGFSSQHKALNDLWQYKDGVWSEIKGFLDSQKPQPRGGASLAFLGGFNYNRDLEFYCVGDNSNHVNRLVLFGGTDGRVYYNDTWVLDEHYSSETVRNPGRRWLLVQPVGEHSLGPSPRAFAACSYAQNGRWSPDTNGMLSTYVGDPGANPACQPMRCAQPALYLFGGRTGLLPTSRDTDDDLVEDGQEYELGSTPAGRDPRINALVDKTNATETVPFAFKRIGSLTPAGTMARGAVANLEALSYPSYYERMYAETNALPYQGYPTEGALTNGIFTMGVDAYSPEMTNLWWHRYVPGANPVNAWELGVPDNSVIGSAGTPPYAYGGRWCFGTDLNGRYPTNAWCELYSPLFSLHLPSLNSTSTNDNRYHLVFYEWLNLADSNDVVRVEVIRPKTGADIANRRPGVGTTPVRIVSERNNAYNTTGAWRRVIAPLDDVANETNLYLRFTLQSDGVGIAGGWYLDDIAILQGGQLSGMFNNTGNVEVALLGENYNGRVQATTIAASNGVFQFDPLPFGNYQVGAVSTVYGPYTLAPGSAVYDMGAFALPAFAVGGIAYGNPTVITWPAVPGVLYVVQYSDDGGATWPTLHSLVAASTTETYIDYPGSTPARWYRIGYVGTP